MNRAPDTGPSDPPPGVCPIHPTTRRSGLAARVRSRWAGLSARRDRGASSVLIVGIVALTLLVFGAVVTVTQVVSLNHATSSAADAASLAGAGELSVDVVLGRSSAAGSPSAARACQTAADVAERNHATLVDCAVVAPGQVQVSVSMRGQSPWQWLTATGTSRAGATFIGAGR